MEKTILDARLKHPKKSFFENIQPEWAKVWQTADDANIKG